MTFVTNDSRMDLTTKQIAGKLSPSNASTTFGGTLARDCRRLAGADFPLP